jgi:hypothetical protein
MYRIVAGMLRNVSGCFNTVESIKTNITAQPDFKV